MPVTTDATTPDAPARRRKASRRAAAPSTARRARRQPAVRAPVRLMPLQPAGEPWYVRGRRIRFLDPSVPEEADQAAHMHMLGRLAHSLGRLARH